VTSVVLASTSVTRSGLLKAAGVDFRSQSPRTDESILKGALLAQGSTPDQIAAELAKAKALGIDADPGALVIGADQTLEFEGRLFDKAADRAEARANLWALRGRTHRLHSAVTLAQAGAVIWSTIETSSLTMRSFTPAFLETYLDANTEAALFAVGGYALEGGGLQLFDRIEGDYFAILGLPMLGLLGQLRFRGALSE
jgi:septum formation protein